MSLCFSQRPPFALYFSRVSKRAFPMCSTFSRFLFSSLWVFAQDEIFFVSSSSGRGSNLNGFLRPVYPPLPFFCEMTFSRRSFTFSLLSKLIPHPQYSRYEVYPYRHNLIFRRDGTPSFPCYSPPPPPNFKDTDRCFFFFTPGTDMMPGWFLSLHASQVAFPLPRPLN